MHRFNRQLNIADEWRITRTAMIPAIMQLSVYWVAIVVESVASIKPDIEILIENDEPSILDHSIKRNTGGTGTSIDRMRRREAGNTYRTAYKLTNVRQQMPREPAILVHRPLG